MPPCPMIFWSVQVPSTVPINASAFIKAFPLLIIDISLPLPTLRTPIGADLSDFLPPSAAGEERRNWGLPVPRTGSPRPRQGDCIPLHPLKSALMLRTLRVLRVTPYNGLKNILTLVHPIQ